MLLTQYYEDSKETFMYSRGIKHIAFVVENIEEVVATVKKKGWEVFVDTHTYENTYKLCYFHGPDGIIIELVEQIAKIVLTLLDM